MKRYLLFVGHIYLQDRGGFTLIDSFDSLCDSKSKALTLLGEDYWSHIYDSKINKVILEAKEKLNYKLVTQFINTGDYKRNYEWVDPIQNHNEDFSISYIGTPKYSEKHFVDPMVPTFE